MSAMSCLSVPISTRKRKGEWETHKKQERAFSAVDGKKFFQAVLLRKECNPSHHCESTILFIFITPWGICHPGLATARTILPQCLNSFTCLLCGLKGGGLFGLRNIPYQGHTNALGGSTGERRLQCQLAWIQGPTLLLTVAQ